MSVLQAAVTTQLRVDASCLTSFETNLGREPAATVPLSVHIVSFWITGPIRSGLDHLRLPFALRPDLSAGSLPSPPWFLGRLRPPDLCTPAIQPGAQRPSPLRAPASDRREQFPNLLGLGVPTGLFAGRFAESTRSRIAVPMVGTFRSLHSGALHRLVHRSGVLVLIHAAQMGCQFQTAHAPGQNYSPGIGDEDASGKPV